MHQTTQSHSNGLKNNILNNLSKEKLRKTTELYRNTKQGFKISNKNFGAIIKFDQPLLLVGHHDLNAKYGQEEFRETNNLTSIDQIKNQNKQKN